MESTVRNFWKMIYDRKSAVIVMMSDLVEGGQEASAQYWPSSGSYQYGEYTVELMGEEPLEGFTIRNLSVMDTKVHGMRVTCTYVVLTTITHASFDRLRKQTM
jgi:protein tyrosine phosphatase